MNSSGRLGLKSGVGIVVSNMIGAGVFISAGFMAQDMGPGYVLLAWLVGGVLALCGARAYATVAEMVPRSGGEYRYLSDLWHPSLGFAAGWSSLLVGFSAPIAVNALSAGAFVETLGLHPSTGLGAMLSGIGLTGAGERLPRLLSDGQLTATVLTVVLTLVHLVGLRSSKTTQNLLVAATWVLLIGFVGLGLVKGNNSWPSWAPPSGATGFPFGAFMGSLFFVAFAFSGWNAAIYAAEDFRQPHRDVPRAMLIGCAIVAVLYLLVNWVFVANLTPERAAVVFKYEESRITLGHLVTRDLAGPTGAAAMSVLAILAFISSMSAMTFSGPRMYAAMARDGYLPKFLGGVRGDVPAGSILLQGALALGLVFTHGLAALLANVGAVLTLFSAMTVAAVIRQRFAPLPGRPRPGWLPVIAAVLYVLSAAWLLWFGVTVYYAKESLRIWLLGIALFAAGAYVVMSVRSRSWKRA